MRRLKHPPRLELPILLALLAAVIVPMTQRPWPARVPVHFDLFWRADGWGSPWEMMGLPGMIAFFLLVNIVMAESWVRLEDGHKRFNLLSPMLAASAGFMAGVQYWYWLNLGVLIRSGYAGGAWFWAAGLALLTAALATALEWGRRPLDDSSLNETQPFHSASGDLRTEIAGRRWTYWTTERSTWLTLLLGGIGVLSVLTEAVTFWAKGVGFGFVGLDALMFGPPLVTVFVAILFAALHIQVNSERLVLRGGLGIRLLRLPLADVSEVKVETFNPLWNYGGWGIRRRAGVTAYIFNSRRGVRLATRNGRDYLIACRDPEKLAEVIRAAVRTA